MGFPARRLQSGLGLSPMKCMQVARADNFAAPPVAVSTLDSRRAKCQEARPVERALQSCARPASERSGRLASRALYQSTCQVKPATPPSCVGRAKNETVTLARARPLATASPASRARSPRRAAERASISAASRMISPRSWLEKQPRARKRLGATRESSAQGKHANLANLISSSRLASRVWRGATPAPLIID